MELSKMIVLLEWVYMTMFASKFQKENGRE